MSLEQKIKDAQSSLAYYKELAALRNDELEKVSAQLEKAREALKFIRDQHCPQRPESALGRTLKDCIEFAREVLGGQTEKPQG